MSLIQLTVTDIALCTELLIFWVAILIAEIKAKNTPWLFIRSREMKGQNSYSDNSCQNRFLT